MGKKILFVLLVGIGIIVNTQVSKAETYVEGTITSNTTWTSANSPYIVTSTVTVAEGVTLTIEPGVIVKFATGTSLINYGKLLAVGIPEGTITFTSNETTPNPGDWNGIKFSGTQSKGSIIRYCEIEYGKQAIYLENTNNVEMTYNTIRYNKGDNGEGYNQRGDVGAGIYILSSVNNIIGSNTISGNTGGDGSGNGGDNQGAGGIGSGIYLFSSGGNIIIGNTISDNTGGKGGDIAPHGENSGSVGGIGAGIYLSSSTTNIITGNTIFNNIGGNGGKGIQTCGGKGGDGVGIYLADNSTDNNIKENTISNSAGGTAGVNPHSSSHKGFDGIGYGIYIDSTTYNNIIDVTNTYNSEEIHYYYNVHTPTVIEGKILTGSPTTNLGKIVLINCSNFEVKNNTISGVIGNNDMNMNGGSGERGGIGAGIYLYSSYNIIIKDNQISNNRGGFGGDGGDYWNRGRKDGGEGGIGCGIYVGSSTNNTITGNTIFDNTGGKGGYATRLGEGGNGGVGAGIYLSSAINNIISNNTISNSIGGGAGYCGPWGGVGMNGCGFGIYIDPASYNNTIDTANTYNGEVIYYFYDVHTPTIIEGKTLIATQTTNIGKIVLIKCSNFEIKNNVISGGIGNIGGHLSKVGENGSGIYLGSCTQISIIGNTISGIKGGEGDGHGNPGAAGGRGVGIYLSSSSNSSIKGNVIVYCEGGRGGVAGYSLAGGMGGIGNGIYLCSSNNNDIEENIISEIIGGRGGNRGAGFGGVRGGDGNAGIGIYLFLSANNRIKNNKITKNRGGSGGEGFAASSKGGDGIGIWLVSSPNNSITSRNLITNNEGGFGVYDSNGKGIGVYCSSSEIVDFTYNNIYNNQVYNLSTDISPGTQTAEYNWWGADPPATSTFFGNIDYDPWLRTPLAYIIFTPKSGPVGTVITISGKGFGNRETIRIDFGVTDNITTVISDTSGKFSTTFTVDTQPYGNTTIKATGLTSGSTDSGVFCILPKIAYVNPTMGTVGCIVTVAGNGYGENELVKIAFGTIPTIQTTSTYAEGSFVTIFTVDTQPYGTTTIFASGLTSGVGAYNTFFIHANIICLTPAYGTVGSSVTIRGNGYGANEVVCIDFGTTLTIVTTSTYAQGSFTTIFTINTQPYGPTIIVATGLITNDRAGASFNIRGTILVISPTSGTVGTSVRIIGNGFGASEYIVISFGKTSTLTAIETNAFGMFDTTFTVDTQSYGTTTIRSVGLSSQQQAMMYIFFIVPNVTLVSPTIGTVGSFVTIAGNGFGQMEGVRIDFGTTISICNITSNVSGAFSVLFTINTQPCGMTSIAVSGLISDTKFFASFMIIPNITHVLPSSGMIGSVVTIIGNGFGATELIRIAFGITTTITLVTTNAQGEFEVKFTINSQPIGTTTIVAYGLITNTNAIAYFVILPLTTLKITPALQNIPVGQEFIAKVEIKDVRRMVTAKLHLNFNPNILELQEIGTGTFPTDGMVSKQYSNGTGKIDYFVGLLTGSATGSGIICTLKFKAKAGGTSTVVFEFNDEKWITRLKDADYHNIPFNKEEALYQVITGIDITPKDKIVKADESINYQCMASCGSLNLDVTGSTTFTVSDGGSFTLNSFLAKYIGTYTIQGAYLGFTSTTSVIITQGTPTILLYISGNNQVNTCTYTLKEPFIVKVVDKYENPCQGVEVNWQIISSTPSGATGYSIFPTKTTTNIGGTASSLLTLGTEPPGTYTIDAISVGLTGSPCVFTAHSLRRFGNIAGFCLLDLGIKLGTSSQIQVTIVESGKTTTTNENSYFIFKDIPVGTYTLNFDTHGASPKDVSGVCISKTQFEDTTYIGTVTLLVGDVNNDGKINIDDWPGLVDNFFKQEGDPGWEESKNADFNHDGRVDDEDFIIFRENFGKGKGNAPQKAKGIKPISSNRIELSFNLETLEGIDINDLRVGNTIYLKVYIRDVKSFLGGEVHLSFNPDVLEVVDAITENTYRNTALSLKMPTEGVQIRPGDYIPQDKLYPLMNKVDNEKGRIDYAVGVMKPMNKAEGVLAIVPFKIKACGASSKIGFDFAEEENRETMFIERTTPQGEGEKPVNTKPEVKSDEVIINVPLVFDNFDTTFVYPNPVRKDNKEIIFANLPNSKLIKLRIFNIAGELVYEGKKQANPTTITWDLRNKDNEYVASGIYIYILEYAGLIKKGKIGVIK